MHVQLFQYICGKHYPFIIGLTEHIVESHLTIYIGAYFWTLFCASLFCISLLPARLHSSGSQELCSKS